MKRTSNKPLYITKDGVETLYKSIREAAKALGWKDSALKYYTRQGWPIPGTDSWRWKDKKTDYCPCDVDWPLTLKYIDYLASMAGASIGNGQWRDAKEYVYDHLIDRALMMRYKWGMVKYLRQCVPWLLNAWRRKEYDKTVSIEDSPEPQGRAYSLLQSLPDHLVPIAEQLLYGYTDRHIASKLHISNAQVQALKEELGRWLQERWR